MIDNNKKVKKIEDVMINADSWVLFDIEFLEVLQLNSETDWPDRRIDRAVMNKGQKK